MQYTVHSSQYAGDSPALTLASLLRMVPAVLEMEHLYSCVHSVQTVQQVSTLLSFKLFFKERYCEVRVWTQSLRVETWLQVRGRKWRENDGPIIQHVPQTRHRHHNLQQRFTFT